MKGEGTRSADYQFIEGKIGKRREGKGSTASAAGRKKFIGDLFNLKHMIKLQANLSNLKLFPN